MSDFVSLVALYIQLSHIQHVTIIYLLFNNTFLMTLCSDFLYLISLLDWFIWKGWGSVVTYMTCLFVFCRWPSSRGVVTVECVFSYMWTRLASAYPFVCFVTVWDVVQRCTSRNPHVQQHCFLSRWTRDYKLRYVQYPLLTYYCTYIWFKPKNTGGFSFSTRAFSFWYVFVLLG